jgi:hypothetical protein
MSAITIIVLRFWVYENEPRRTGTIVVQSVKIFEKLKLNHYKKMLPCPAVMQSIVTCGY